MEKTLSSQLAKTKKLTPQQVKVLTLLVSGHSYEAVANAEEIPVQQIHTWMKNDAFHEEYKLAMERFRSIFEGRTVAVAQKAIKVINDFLDDKNPEMRLEAAKIAVNSAVRLSNRYKELQVQGFVPAAQPLVIFPSNTQLPWAAKPELPMLPEVPTDIIDAESVPVPGDPETESDE